MARMKNGILGGLTGRIGDVEGYIRNGVPMLRAKRRKTKKKPSVKQLAQRQKMALANVLINTMTDFVALGYGPFSAKETFSANNAAKSHQITHAIIGEYPDQTIDYAKVQLSKGNLLPPQDANVEVITDGLKFSWDGKPMENYYNNAARVMVLAYSAELGESYYTTSGANRTEGSYILNLPLRFRDKELEVYISIMGIDLKQVSNSVYLGTVTC